MSNENNNNGTKYLDFAAGWVKTTRAGSEYISGLADSKRTGLKLLLENGNGEVVEVTSFAVFFNQSKKNDKAPDVRFVFNPTQS